MTQTAIVALPAVAVQAEALPRQVERWAAWTNLVVAAFIQLATFPSRAQGLGWITQPLLTEFSLGQLAYSKMNFWATIGTALFCIPCGWCVDRLGIRVCLLVVVPALSSATLWMSTLVPDTDSSLWIGAFEFRAGYAWLFVALLVCRMLGQGALALVSTALVGKSFPRKVGVVMGVYSVIVGLGYSGASKLVGLCLNSWGMDWHGVWFWTGAIMLGVLLPVGVLLVREPRAAAVRSQSDAALSGITFRQALTSGVFWMCILSSLLVGMVNSGLALFNEPVLKDLGFTTRNFFDVLAFSLLIATVFKLTAGWLAVHWSIGRLKGGMLLLMSACLVWLPFVQWLTELYIYSVAMALAMSVQVVLYFAIWSHAFGRRELGQIQGAHICSVLASALGPWVLALSKEYTGSYNRSFITLAVLVGVLGVAFFFVRVPCADEPAAKQGA